MRSPLHNAPSMIVVGDASLPFGGYKQSGWRREMAEEVSYNYTEIRAVTPALWPVWGNSVDEYLIVDRGRIGRRRRTFLQRRYDRLGLDA